MLRLSHGSVTRVRLPCCSLFFIFCMCLVVSLPSVYLCVSLPPGSGDSDTQFIDPELRDACAVFPLLVTFCESMLDPKVKRCLFCGYTAKNRLSVEDLEAKNPELMTDLRMLFGEGRPRCGVSGVGSLYAGSSIASTEEEEEEEDEEQEEDELEQEDSGVVGLLHKKVATKELLLFCCSTCKRAPAGIGFEEKAVGRLENTLLSQKDDLIQLRAHAPRLVPFVRPVLATLIAEVLLKKQSGVSMSRARHVVKFALQELRSGRRRIWRSTGGDISPLCRTRLRRLLPETTLAGPPGRSWPTTFVALLIPPSNDEAHVLCCRVLLKRERERAQLQNRQ